MCNISFVLAVIQEPLTFISLINHALSLYTEELNTVSESAELVDVASSISTNLISPNTDPPTISPSEMMCERSCEELANLFQELKGLRVVVSNLIDGLQKVVSLSELRQACHAAGFVNSPSKKMINLESPLRHFHCFRLLKLGNWVIIGVYSHTYGRNSGAVNHSVLCVEIYGYLMVMCCNNHMSTYTWVCRTLVKTQLLLAHCVETHLFSTGFQTEENTAMREALNKMQDPVQQSICWHDGRLFENKEDWIVDSCTKCTCQDGKVVCRQITCPPVSCANPSFVDGECCPVCLRECLSQFIYHTF